MDTSKIQELRFKIAECKDFNNSTQLQEANQELDLVNITINALEKELKELRHLKSRVTGLYAIDFDPKQLVNRFINSQSDACNLEEEEAGKFHQDWGKWIDNENYVDSPFIEI